MKLIPKYQSPAGPIRQAPYFASPWKVIDGGQLPGIVVTPAGGITADKYPYLYKIHNKMQDMDDQRFRRDTDLPIDGNITTVTNAGSITGALINPEWIKRIQYAAQQTGVPVYEALGLAAKETTLGNETDNQSIKRLWSPKTKALIRRYEGPDALNFPTEQHIGNAIHAIESGRHYTWSDLMGNYAYWRADPYTQEYDYITHKLKVDPADFKRMEDILAKNWKYDLKNADSYIVPDPVMDALRRYKQGIYNKGQADHTKSVKDKGAELKNSEIIGEIIND